MRRRGFPLFRAFGIPIRADASWLLILALVLWTLAAGYFPQILPGQSRTTYWLMGAAASLLFFGSVLLHELSHSIVAMRFGLPVHAITLFVFGGVSEIGEESPSPKVEFWMAIAGPLMSFALAAVFWGAAVVLGGPAGPPIAIAILVYLAFINALLGAFNLVPGFPLDGGRVLRAILWAWRGDVIQATRWASYAGKGVGGLLIGLGLIGLINGALFIGLWYAFIGLFLWQAADAAYEQLVVSRHLTGLTVGQVMNRPGIGVPSGTTLSQLVDDYIFRLRYASYPVLDGEQPVGMITLHQLRQVPRDRWDRVQVQSVMSPVAEPLSPEMPLTDALKVFGQSDQRRLPVVERQRLVGVLSMTDVASALQIADFRRDRRQRPAA